MSFNFKNLKSEKGQSLVEMTIAIAIILTGLMGALALTVSNLSGVGEAGTRVVASNLAKEGIDVARNIRDTNWLENNVWDNRLSSGDFTAIAIFKPAANEWSLDFSPSSIFDAAAKLYRDENNLYLQDTAPPVGTATLYSRLITLDPICLNTATKIETISGNPCGGGEEEKTGIRVKSEVTWTESGRSHSLVLEDRLYNWK